MNNGRIWCVVNPTVGLPAFLGSVALISFTVHFAVLNNTTWVGDFFKGSSKATASLEGSSTPFALNANGAATFVINVVPSDTAQGAKPIVVTVSPQGLAEVVDGPPSGVKVAAQHER